MSSTVLVDSIIEAHGGLNRYSKLSTIETTFDLTGAIFALKGRPTHFTPRVSVSTKEQKVTYHGIGGPPNEAWVFTPSKIYKQSPSGDIIESRESPRAAFADHAMDTPWDDFHLVYFVGYALWQYLNFPYFLARTDFISKELAPHQEFGETLRVLEVTFPDQAVFASHNKTQKYYFDDRLQLVRHDYAPDVLAGAWAAHYSVDNVAVGGMKFATMRRVVSLGPEGKPMYNGPIPTLVNVVFTGIELKRTSGSPEAEDAWTLVSAPAP